MAWRNHLVRSSPNTNVHPAFGSERKRERNVSLVYSLINLNQAAMMRIRIQNLSENSNDPLKRNPDDLYQLERNEYSIAGRTHGAIRAAAPGQVAWKNSYWLQQRTRATRQTAIGPYTQSSLPKQSILYRISDALSGINKR
jgi:hypothetical protein